MPAELQDVPHRGPAEAIQALVVVAHHAEVLVVSGQAEHDLFLDVVRVLVFVHQHVARAADHLSGNGWVAQQVVEQLLLVREIQSVARLHRLLVPHVRRADLLDKGIVAGNERLRIEEFLGDLVEVTPARLRSRSSGCSNGSRYLPSGVGSPKIASKFSKRNRACVSSSSTS